jgi:hypothetical protein
VLGAAAAVTIEKLVIADLPSPFQTLQTPAKARGVALGWKWNGATSIRYGLDLTTLQMDLVNIRRTRKQGYEHSFALAA